ncbi:MAG: hypothetical protein ABI947_01080 [Chloroflexota bacterium]
MTDYRTGDGIVRFVRDVLHADPTPYQIAILQALVEYRRVAVRGPHGLGKTALSAWVVLWSLAAFDTDVKVPVTAGAWRQLEKFTFPEIRKWAAKADWEKVGLQVRRGKEIFDLFIKLENKEAFAVASDNPALIEGAHASTVTFVLDEAKAIPNDIWDAAEGAFSAAGEDTGFQAFALAISTPGTPSGRFYEISSHKPGFDDWHAIHVTLEESIAAGRISRRWADQRQAQWGETSAVYQNRVLGEFADSDEEGVIPLSWVEQANRRWDECGGTGEGRVCYGVDPAYKGTDKTAIARLVGNVCERIDTYSRQDTMQTVGRVIALVDKQTPIGVDVIGVGAGVYDRLHEQGYSATPVNVANATDMHDSSGQQGFVNLRSALWWMLRDALDPSGDVLLAIPPDDILTGDLTAPTWSYTSSGHIKIESKDEMRARIGRSTDKADALALARYVAVRSSRKIMGFV